MTVDHRRGQYRAELFDQVVYRLLFRVFPNATISRTPVLTSRGSKTAVTVDFALATSAGFGIVETKAPYTESSVYGVNRGLRHLKTAVDRLSRREDLRGELSFAIFIVAGSLPDAAVREADDTRTYIESKHVKFDIWDESAVINLVHQYFGVQLRSLAPEHLELFLEELGTQAAWARADAARAQAATPSELPVGERDGVVVLAGDFCSFSRFVHASGDDAELVTSIMGRFYRETRQAIVELGGVLDKFMGDGLLAYWFEDRLILDFEKSSSASLASQSSLQTNGKIKLISR